jgi:hypothetical protein
MNSDSKPLGLVVCMPTRGAVSIETMLCLREHLDGYPNELLTAFRMPVVEARNQLAKEARELNPTPLDFDPKYVLWVDDDAWWPSGHVDRAVSILEDHADVDMVSGLFCIREPFAPPAAVTTEHRQIGPKQLWCPYFPLKYQPGELTPLIVAGSHCFIIRRAMLQTVGDAPFNRLTKNEAFPSDRTPQNPLQPEDFSFCVRVNNVGGKIVIERSLLVGHVDVTSGLCYYPNSPALMANGLGAPYYAKDASKGYDSAVRSYHSDDKGENVWKLDIPTFKDEPEAA